MKMNEQKTSSETENRSKKQQKQKYTRYTYSVYK